MKYICSFILLLATMHTASAQTGLITTISGTGVAGSIGDNGPANAAQLNAPAGVAVDAAGNIYLADLLNNRIRKINTAGIITNFAGNGLAGHSGDGFPATAAGITGPRSIATDATGNVYFTDQQFIRKVDAAGIITTIAGTAAVGSYSGDGFPATSTTFSGNFHIAASATGVIYVSDANFNRVFKFNPATGGIVTTIAGTGTTGYFGDGVPASVAMLNAPLGIVTDAADNVYFIDGGNFRIRKISPSGIIRNFAGTGANGHGGDNGPATAATIGIAMDIDFDASGNLYVADVGNQYIRRIDNAGIITTYGGDGAMGYAGDNGPATNAQLEQVQGIACFQDKVYVSQRKYHVLRRIRGIDRYAPAFVSGSIDSFIACENNGAKDLSSVLTVNDADVGETQTWSVAVAPLHGVAAAAYSTVSAGTAITPTGITYTPTIGYTGKDSFKVCVSDGLRTDTIAFRASVHVHGFCLVGESVLDENRPQVFPNPVSAELHIEGMNGPVSYRLYNYMGVCVVRGTLLRGSSLVSVRNVPAGRYFLVLDREEGIRSVIPVIKE